MARHKHGRGAAGLPRAGAVVEPLQTTTKEKMQKMPELERHEAGDRAWRRRACRPAQCVRVQFFLAGEASPGRLLGGKKCYSCIDFLTPHVKFRWPRQHSCQTSYIQIIWLGLVVSEGAEDGKAAWRVEVDGLLRLAGLP